VKFVRFLLMKGARRDQVTFENQTCLDLIPSNCSDSLKRQLRAILAQPSYLECFMLKTPMVKLSPNQRTQLLFLIFYVLILAGQFLIIVPN